MHEPFDDPDNTPELDLGSDVFGEPAAHDVFGDVEDRANRGAKELERWRFSGVL